MGFLTKLFLYTSKAFFSILITFHILFSESQVRLSRQWENMSKFLLLHSYLMTINPVVHIMCYAQIMGTLKRPKPIYISKEPLFMFELGLAMCPKHWHDQRVLSSVGVGYFFLIIAKVGVRVF